MDREWIDIKGRKLLWMEFIIILDDYRYRKIIFERGEMVCAEYNRMICVLQEMTDDYYQGRDYITDELKNFFEQHHMKMPMERKLPEALDELFEQLQSNLNVNLIELLDECLRKTERMYRRMQEERQKEVERRDVVRSLIEKNGIVEVEEIEDKVSYFLKLQKAKLLSPDYILGEKEIRLTKVWSELLISSMFSGLVTFEQMQRLIEIDLVSESAISALLKNKYNIEKDYEWYVEDFLGCELDEPTVLKIEDIFSLCEVRVKEVLGVSN